MNGIRKCDEVPVPSRMCVRVKVHKFALSKVALCKSHRVSNALCVAGVSHGNRILFLDETEKDALQHVR